MSKSLGNVVAPDEVIDRFGADALRWYFFTSKQPWDGYLFSPEAIGEGVRLFLRQLWNTYAFSTLYEPDAARADAPQTDLDRWVRSRLGATVEIVTERLDELRRHHRRPRDRGVRRRPLQLVRAPLAAALLGRRRRRARHAAPLPRDGVAAARAVRPVRRRRDLRQPRRHRAERPPHRLARARGARPRARGGDGDRARDRAPRPRRARRREAQGPPAAARGRRRRGRARARGDRAAGRRRARGAQRQEPALRLGDRRARVVRAEAELPHARAALRQGDAAGRRRRRGARRRPRRRGAARGPARSASSSTATTTSSAATTCSS